MAKVEFVRLSVALLRLVYVDLKMPDDLFLFFNICTMIEYF